MTSDIQVMDRRHGVVQPRTFNPDEQTINPG